VKHVPGWFPGAGFKRTAQEWKKNLENVVDKPYAFVRQRMDNHMDSRKLQPSYLSNLFKASGYPLVGSEEEIIAKWTAGSLYTGGADTVCFDSALLWISQLTIVRPFALLKHSFWL
jgi:hypothetical protein